MKQLYAVVFLNGNRYRVQGLSHDSSGSRIHYPSIEEMEKSFHERLENCQRIEETPEDLAACWACTKGEDRYRIEAHHEAGVPSPKA